MAGPLTEAEELELLELELEEAQARVRPAAKSPFLQRGMNMVAGAQATAPQTRASLPGPQGGGDRMTNRTDSAVLAKAREVQADIESATRRARVKPVERKAGTVGRAKTLEQLEGMSPFVAGMGGGNAAQIAGQAASEQVYNEADVMSLPTAIDLRTINAIAAGVPGIVNKDFRGKLAQAGEDQPGGALLGDIQGFLAPGMAAWDTAAAGVNALARPFIPRGADAASRTVRYGAPLAGQVTGAAAQNAAFQAGVQEPIRAETAGEDLTLGGMAAAAKRGLEDPLNFLPVGLSAVNRTWNQLTSGIATPSTRAAEMANLYGVGPRQTAASQGIAQTTQALGGQLQGADIRGLTNIENALRFALRDNRNIPNVNARIATGFQRIRESLPLEDDPTLNLARLIEREFAPDAPQTRDIIRNFLRGVGLNSPGGGQIVGDAANQMRGQQADVLRTELESSFGAQPKTEANAAMQQSLDQFSAAYNTVLGAAPRQGPQVERALELLAREPQSAAILDDIAQSQNLTAEQFIERNPLEALHVVQSELATQARAMAARGDASAGPLEITVRNMQRPLRDAVPGYGDLQGLWRQWTQARERMGYVRGAAAGTGGELSTVPGFGDKIFGPGGIAKSEMGTQTAADLYLQMDDLSQRAAGLSVRDVINDELRKGKAAGLEERYQTAANMRRVATEGGLDALRRVFGEAGDRVARRIEQFMDANEFARNIDPEFNSATMNKAQAMATGAQPFASGLGQSAQGASNAMTESAVADAVLMLSGAPPIISAMRAPGIVGRLLQPGQRTQRNIAETLLRRGEIGNQVPPRPGGPAPITPIDPAMVPGARPPPGGAPPAGGPPAGGTPPQAPRTVGVAPAAAGAPVSPAGAPVPPPPVRGAGFALGPDTTNALAGGTLGGIAPAESDEERLRNIAIGTGLGAGARRGSQMLDDATRTVGRPRVPGSAAPSGRTVGQGGYFGRQSLRPPGSGPSAREIETQQQWSTATPIVSQARTTAQSAQQAADAALQSKAPADIARAKDAKKTLVGQLQEAQASRAGMDTPEDARLAETLASLAENTSDPVLLSTQISAAKTSLDRLLTDIGSPVEGNLIPVRTNILTRTQAPRSAAEPAPERPSVTRYAEGTDEIKPQGFGAGENPTSDSIRQKIVGAYAETEGLSNRDRGSRLKQAVEDYRSFVRTASADELRATSDLHFDRDLLFKLEAPQLAKMMKTLGLPAPSPTMALSEMRDAIKQAINPTATSPLKPMGFGASTPKTPQQAARFETPGSPEYEAAVAKGLDMSQAGRMGRAKEMGYTEEGYIPMWEKDDYGASGEWTRKNKQRVFTTAREAEGNIVRTQEANNEIFGFNPQASDGRLLAARKAMYETPEYKSGNMEEWRKTPEYEAYKQIEKLLDRQAARGNALARVELVAARLGQRLNIPGGRIVGVDEIFGPIKKGKLSPDVTSYGETTVMLPVTRFIDDALQGKNLEKTVRKYIFDEFGEDALLENPREVETYIKSLLNAAEWVRNRKLSDEVESYARWYAGEGTDKAMPGIAAPDRPPTEIMPPSIMRVLVKRDKDGNIENIRSVNAAFDPDKATSSTLLAAAPFAAVGGAGLTLAGEDARNQRTVGKPKASQSGTSQSARTVGKAKTN